MQLEHVVSMKKYTQGLMFVAALYLTCYTEFKYPCGTMEVKESPENNINNGENDGK